MDNVTSVPIPTPEACPSLNLWLFGEGAGDMDGPWISGPGVHTLGCMALHDVEWSQSGKWSRVGHTLPSIVLSQASQKLEKVCKKMQLEMDIRSRDGPFDMSTV